MSSPLTAKKSEFRLTLDGRKRVSLTKLLPEFEVTSFKAYRDGDRIILEPMKEVPAREMRLYSPAVYASIKRGLDQAETGNFRRLTTDFTQFVDENI